MNIISLVSMKGGVGKTSLTSGIAAALVSRLGKNRVFVIDLDPKNMLLWHFGLFSKNGKGIAHSGASSATVVDMHALVLRSESGIRCLPFGNVSEAERKQFESVLANNPDYLVELIENLGFDRDCIVLIDTPPGHSIYQKQALRASNMAISVALPDAATYATVASMESAFHNGFSNKPSVYVVNQYDQRQALGIDVVHALKNQLAKRIAPIFISYDEGVREALAVQQTCLQYDPHGQGSHDVDQLSQWLIRLLNGGVG